MIDDRGGFLSRDAKSLRQSKRGHAVGDAVVDHLAALAHLGCHLALRHAEDPRRGGHMNVRAALERVDHRGLATQRGDNAQFNLRVIRGQQQVIVPARHERLAYLLAESRTNRNVLQVWILRVQPPGGGGQLVEGGVDAAGP